MSIAKAILAETEAERTWYADQVLVNAAARRMLLGNSKVVVLEQPDGSVAGAYPVSSWDEVMSGASTELKDALEARLAAGWRVVRGDVLYTKSDNPRPYKAPKA